MNKSKFLVLLEKIPDLNTDSALKMIGGSASIYEKVFRKIIKLLPAHSEEMKKHLFEDRDLAAFAVKIHGVKSSLAQIGHRGLSENAAMLERAAKSGNADICGEYFGPFNIELMSFWEAACCVINNAETESKVKTAPFGGNVGNFCQVLEKAKAAAEDFECSKTAELLIPVISCSFGVVTDRLLQETASALETFSPLKAAECLSELLEEYKKTPEWH